MRHIKKDFNNTIARNKLESASYKSDVNTSVLEKKGNYPSSKYGHPIIRKELYDLYFNKCAYCESEIKPVSTENVEHYRPKAKISRVNEQGYYWLGYEWSNLLIACPSCNGAKLTKFPLKDNNHILIHPRDVHGNTDFSLFPDSKAYLVRETPLLINPEKTDPKTLLYIDKLGKLIPIGNNIAAKTTIKEIQLNRDSLVFARQREIDKVINRIREQIKARFGSNPLTDSQYKNQLNLIFNEIVERTKPTSEYTMLGKCMIERFDELILEDIEKIFRKQIKDYFIDYLTTF